METGKTVKRKPLSKAARERIAAAQRARWAKFHRGKSYPNHMATYMAGAIDQIDHEIAKKTRQLADIKKLRDVVVALDKIARAA